MNHDTDIAHELIPSEGPDVMTVDQAREYLARTRDGEDLSVADFLEEKGVEDPLFNRRPVR